MNDIPTNTEANLKQNDDINIIKTPSGKYLLELSEPQFEYIKYCTKRVKSCQEAQRKYSLKKNKNKCQSEPKRRGRPPKRPPKEKTDIEDIVSELIPKRRGRPPKLKDHTIDEQCIPKRRGRPPKIKEHTIEELPTAKKRGRPSKKNNSFDSSKETYIINNDSFPKTTNNKFHGKTLDEIWDGMDKLFLKKSI